ncbi:nucleoside triphosphate pyrophosphatase [Thioalkalivibrio sp. XN8]|uniref:Maf family protein n=1 Tax=Thioalkalivibrio sp. XN8 TaxID=2712863 RepID=UPI0013EDE398|nr:nucleoside triphosphate pyrophosphatase [Thioalkalivibrio sp. XN8]NGP53849.1 septum formation protein Maf [Thioalkalivibrio sp. XN8]
MNATHSAAGAGPALVLASASPYRRALLERFQLPFRQQPADIDEARQPGESPAELVRRLARRKAETVAASHPGAVVIGSDQVAVRGDDVLGKPGDAAEAIAQLTRSAGRYVEFLTAVCVLGPAADGEPDEHIDITRVVFRPLAADEIHRYVERERPFDCAGSFRAEALGIALFERIDSQDPTGLIGLPLIWLAGALRRLGIPVP